MFVFTHRGGVQHGLVVYNYHIPVTGTGGEVTYLFKIQ